MSGYTCPFQSPSIFALRLGDIYLGLRDAEDVAKSDPMLLWGGDMLLLLLFPPTGCSRAHTLLNVHFVLFFTVYSASLQCCPGGGGGGRNN